MLASQFASRRLCLGSALLSAFWAVFAEAPQWRTETQMFVFLNKLVFSRDCYKETTMVNLSVCVCVSVHVPVYVSVYVGVYFFPTNSFPQIGGAF